MQMRVVCDLFVVLVLQEDLRCHVHVGARLAGQVKAGTALQVKVGRTSPPAGLGTVVACIHQCFVQLTAAALLQPCLVTSGKCVAAKHDTHT